jgi:hypothetical protein
MTAASIAPLQMTGIRYQGSESRKNQAPRF